jgi:two-component system cell cycle sensor histidine kinase/response regulator CckA
MEQCHSMATILIAEDERMVMSILKIVLSRDGHTVIEAFTAQEAITKSDERAGPIELLVTDHLLHGVLGRHVAEQILQTRPAMKVLHISGHPLSNLFVDECLPPGAAFLQKPFTPAEISQVVRELVTSATPRSFYA